MDKKHLAIDLVISEMNTKEKGLSEPQIIETIKGSFSSPQEIFDYMESEHIIEQGDHSTNYFLTPIAYDAIEAGGWVEFLKDKSQPESPLDIGNAITEILEDYAKNDKKELRNITFSVFKWLIGLGIFWVLYQFFISFLDS